MTQFGLSPRPLSIEVSIDSVGEVLAIEHELATIGARSVDLDVLGDHLRSGPDLRCRWNVTERTPVPTASSDVDDVIADAVDRQGRLRKDGFRRIIA